MSCYAGIIASVEVDSPAWEVGLERGCQITAADGHPLRDVIDWRWWACDEAVTVSYIDNDGEAGEVELVRSPGEDWGSRKQFSTRLSNVVMPACFALCGSFLTMYALR